MTPDSSEMQCRVHGDAAGPVLVYLPGLHGDWTLIGGLRAQLGERVRFIEFAYPRRPDLPLEDYALAISERLDSLGNDRCHLLAESFGSQVAWSMLRHAGAAGRIQSLILAGGFVRHPLARGTSGIATTAARFPSSVLLLLMKMGMPVARLFYEKRPALADDFRAFAEARAVPGDREAISSRLRMIAAGDPSETARAARLPVYHLTGFWDPVVPWQPVRRWLLKNCPGYRASHVIASADHAVLVSRPTRSTTKILTWIAGA